MTVVSGLAFSGFALRNAARPGVATLQKFFSANRLTPPGAAELLRRGVSELVRRIADRL
jgi:hypothetical protein